MHVLQLVGRFVVHTICGVLLFALVGLAALFFNWFGQWVVEYGMNAYIADAIRSLEFFVFGVDFFLFTLFMLREALCLARAMMTMSLRKGLLSD